MKNQLILDKTKVKVTPNKRNQQVEQATKYNFILRNESINPFALLRSSSFTNRWKLHAI